MRKILFSLLLGIGHLTLNGVVRSEQLQLAEPSQEDLTTKLNLYKLHFDKIEGWFFRPFLDVLTKINQFQIEKNIAGNIAEIGVFHGKSFIPLYHMSRAGEHVLAIDCFDQQQFNYDNSGPGCKFNSFINNIKTYCDANLTRLEVLQGDTTEMTGKNFLGKCKNGLPFRIFSIDGSHQAKQTEMDANNALEVLAVGGVVVVDDFFNYSWPGVSTGISKFLINHPEIKPFFIGFNKVLLTHKDYADQYREYIKRFYNPLREAVFFDSVTAIYE